MPGNPRVTLDGEGMQDYVAILGVKGIMIGSIYALISLGFNVIYRTTGVLNLAQGEFVVWGGLLASWAHAVWSLPLYGAVLVGMLGTGVLGWGVDLLAIRPVRGAQPVVHIIVTVGVSIILRALAALIWGTEPYHLPPIQTGGTRFLGVFVEYQNLWMLGAAAVGMGVLAVFFRSTKTGRAMRACAENPEASRLCGVSPGRMSALAFSLSAVLAGLGGVLLTPLMSMSFDRGMMLGLKGFSAAILGGLGYPVGGVISGLILGVLEQFSVWYSSVYKETLALSVVVLVLLFRPQGLFQRR
jgi:branched-chain amino acid transport system permease protein